MSGLLASKSRLVWARGLKHLARRLPRARPASRLVWARGLKLEPGHQRARIPESRLMWARGLKRLGRDRQRQHEGVAPRVGAWVETTQRSPKRQGCRASRLVWARGLKHRVRARSDHAHRSRLVWARGLKQAHLPDQGLQLQVAPRVGAWVETGRPASRRRQRCRRASCGRVG